MVRIMSELLNELKTELESQQEGDAITRADREMCSLSYKCDFDQSINTGKVVAGGFFGDGFICGEQNQREVNFIQPRETKLSHSTSMYAYIQ